MNLSSILTLALTWTVILAGIWLGWQLLRQNGRILLRLDELEQRLNELEFGKPTEPTGLPVGSAAASPCQSLSLGSPFTHRPAHKAGCL